MHWPATLDALRDRGPVGELPLQGGVRLDAEQLVLQQPDDDVGGILIDVSGVAKRPQQRQRRRNEKTGKGDGHDPQRQRPFEIETRRCDGFHSHQGAFHCEGPLRTSMLHAPPVQGKQPAHRRAICPGRGEPPDEPRDLGGHPDTVSRAAPAQRHAGGHHDTVSRDRALDTIARRVDLAEPRKCRKYR